MPPAGRSHRAFSATFGSFDTKLSDTAKVPDGSESDSLNRQNSSSLMAAGTVDRRAQAAPPKRMKRMTHTIHASADERMHVLCHGAQPARGFRLQAEVSES